MFLISIAACSNGNKGETNAPPSVPNSDKFESSRQSSNSNRNNSNQNTSSSAASNSTNNSKQKSQQQHQETNANSKKSVASEKIRENASVTNGSSAGSQPNKTNSVSGSTTTSTSGSSSSAVTPASEAAIAIKQKWLGIKERKKTRRKNSSNNHVLKIKEMGRGYALLFSFVSSLRKKEENVKWCKKADML